MHIDVLTLFPEMISSAAACSMLGRAQKNGIITVNAVNIRDFTLDRHKKTDEAPYGGGEGMVMTVQPVFDALKSVDASSKRLIYLSPKGRMLDRSLAEELAGEEDLVFLCGHYEGIDQRIIDYWHPDEVSIGDYILTGGELGALVIIDAVSRMLPGVLGNQDSVMRESIYSGLLEAPQYTRPYVYEGMEVPEILMSGDHEKIALWRYEQALRETKEKRPDMWADYIKRAGELGLGKPELRLLADVSGIESFRPPARRKRKKKKQKADTEI